MSNNKKKVSLELAAYKPRPWERQPEESDVAFEAFVKYRDMGTARSIRKVAETLAKSEAIIKRWSYTHGWIARVSVYETYQDRLRQDAKNKAELKELAFYRETMRKTGRNLAMLGANTIVHTKTKKTKIKDLATGEEKEVPILDATVNEALNAFRVGKESWKDSIVDQSETQIVGIEIPYHKNLQALSDGELTKLVVMIARKFEVLPTDDNEDGIGILPKLNDKIFDNTN